MSDYTISRIANVLEAQFDGLIDMSDLAGRPAEDLRKAFLSRALAALCVKNLSGVDPATAGGSVTDGFHDGGLDAIYFDQTSDTLLLVQSKWSQRGNKPMDPDATGAFVEGVRDLLSLKFERFNDKIKAKGPQVRLALWADREVRLQLITAHTAIQPTPSYATRKIDDLVQKLNDPVVTANSSDFDQAGVYKLATAESRPPKITLQIGINDWGQIAQPFLAYYGRVSTGDVAKWWSEYQNALFSQNLRLFYTRSDVNEALRRTLDSDPESFWYFNNGITIICDSVTKSLAGAAENKFGVFTCQGVSIVNGAQTVGIIGSVNGKHGATPGDPGPMPSWVQVRIISLEHCPPDFSGKITRAANLQNAVGNREFAAMDPRQHQLATDFALDKRKYAYKQSESDPKGEEGCSIGEATQALGCAYSVALAVQVKREIGAVWADTNAPPYTDIFHDNLTSAQVWRAVLVMRAVDEELQQLRSSDIPRAEIAAVHMNRIVLHLVFQDPQIQAAQREDISESALIKAARAKVRPIFVRVSSYLEKYHQNEYLASLCKNHSKCEELVEAIARPVSPTDRWSGDMLTQSSLLDELEGKMAKTATPQSDQGKSFIQAARELGADQSEEAFDDALRKIATAPATQSGSKRPPKKRRKS